MEAWGAASYLIFYEYKKGQAIQALQNIEIHMKGVVTNGKVMKTGASMLSLVAIPFTGGISLFASGLGAVTYIGSRVTESTMLSFLAERAREELEDLYNVAKKIDCLEIDWIEVGKTIVETVVCANLINKLKVIPKLANLCPKFIQCTLESLVENIKKICAKPGECIAKYTGSGACGTLTPAFSCTKLGSKAFVYSLLVIGAVMGVLEIIRIWTKDDPKALTQIREAIRMLKDEELDRL
ncbi:hypothetical protein LOD99_6646 [Oopsacas minuta]|uniref:Uncharacterized protein n=1 Tax=Oopsacas minuta TaxID=111878 RepID=A0AAV7JLQ1_9METZ|nr:hypothetical protein LOD99_6646 [Oopsacas minuta]